MAKNDDKVFAVFGLGSFGMEICNVLAEKGARVIAFDNQEELIERIKETVTQAILIDTTDEESIKAAPLNDIDTAIVAMGNNVESSILTSAFLKKHGVPYIIARAISDIHMRVLKQIGVNEVINIEIDEGRRVANRIYSPNLLETIPISEDQSIVEVFTPKKFAGKSLYDLKLRQKFNLYVVSIKKKRIALDDLGNPMDEEIITLPDPYQELDENDILFIVGNNEDLKAIQEE
jgi:trk system potassium uptake protein